MKKQYGRHSAVNDRNVKYSGPTRMSFSFLSTFCSFFFALCSLFFVLSFAACSFDYDASTEGFENDPDVIMKDVEYVRMENVLPVVRIRSKEARRYEAKHAMEMDDFSFEQYNPVPSEDSEIPDINVRGAGGSVKIETDSGNLTMAGGVSIDVKSEDLSLRTESLSWEDNERLFSAPGEVTVTRSDGTELSGRNLSADTRRRRWRFEEAVSGDVVEEDEETEEDSVSTVDETVTSDEITVEESAVKDTALGKNTRENATLEGNAAAGRSADGSIDKDKASSAVSLTGSSTEEYRRVGK
jgi:LPS export ABC transporter protein LptC